MSERVETRLRFRRRPRPTGIGDAEVREDVLKRIADTFVLTNGASPLVRFFGDGWEEELDLSDELDEGGREEACAAVVLQLSARPGVTHRFREGEVAIDRRRVLAVLEVLDAATLRWRLHRRRVGEGEAGCGVLLDDWSAGEGEGLDALPGPLREWLDVGNARMLEFQTEERRTGPPVPWIRAAVLEVGGDVPPDAVGMAAVVGRAVDGELVARGQDCGLIFVLRGRTLERWEVRGEPPCSFDDLIRAVVIHSKAEAAALVHPGTVQIDNGPTKRCFVVLAQRDGRLCRRILPLDFADDGRVTAREPHYLDAGEPEVHWIGVPPSQKVELAVQAPENAPGGVLPEG